MLRSALAVRSWSGVHTTLIISMGPGRGASQRALHRVRDTILGINSPLSKSLQIGETDFKILADHTIHVDEHMHDLPHERQRAMHEPSCIDGIARRQHCELSGVVAFERCEEIELDYDF